MKDPPIFYVRAASERMADDHDIVLILIELPPRLVRDGNLAQSPSALERKGRDDVY